MRILSGNKKSYKWRVLVVVKKELREREVVCLVWCFEMTLRRRCVLRDERCASNWKTE